MIQLKIDYGKDQFQFGLKCIALAFTEIQFGLERLQCAGNTAMI